MDTMANGRDRMGATVRKHERQEFQGLNSGFRLSTHERENGKSLKVTFLGLLRPVYISDQPFS